MITFSVLLSAFLACPMQDAGNGATAAVPKPKALDPGHYGKVYLENDAASVEAVDRGEMDASSFDAFSQFCDVYITKDDKLVTAVDKGIVWYGRWEDAVAEAQRSGRPILVHIGSPRVLKVCGVW